KKNSYSNTTIGLIIWRAISRHLSTDSHPPHMLEQTLSRNLEHISLPRKTILRCGGDQAEWMYFFLQGFAVVYVNVDTGDLCTRIALHLYRNGDFLLPNSSIADEDPNLVEIELASDTELLRLPGSHYSHLTQTCPKISAFDQQCRSQSEMEWIGNQAMLRTMRTVSDRMLWLYANYPECFSSLPDQVIGDLIGGFSREI